MPTKQGTLVPLEREATAVSDAQPRRVYIGDHPTAGAGNYVFVDSRSEATAWLKETAADVYKFDDDSAEDDGKPMLVSTTPNTVIL